MLGDGVRVLTRIMRQITEVAGDMGEKVRDRQRSVGHRLIEIGRASRAGEVAQRVGEKDLAVETPEGGVALEEQHPRIAQHRRCGLYPAFLASEFKVVGRGVMLNLLTRRKIILARRCWRRVADPMPPAERR